MIEAGDRIIDRGTVLSTRRDAGPQTRYLIEFHTDRMRMELDEADVAPGLRRVSAEGRVVVRTINSTLRYLLIPD